MVGRLRKVIDNARDFKDSPVVKHFLNGEQIGLNDAFCSAHYVLEVLAIRGVSCPIAVCFCFNMGKHKPNNLTDLNAFFGKYSLRVYR